MSEDEVFYIYMGIFNKKKEVKVTKPKVAKVKVEEIEDRSAYNCVDCGGDGLVNDGNGDTRCSKCGGTGKV